MIKVINGTGEGCEMEYAVHCAFDSDGLRDVMFDKLKPRMIERNTRC